MLADAGDEEQSAGLGELPAVLLAAQGPRLGGSSDRPLLIHDLAMVLNHRHPQRR